MGGQAENELQSRTSSESSIDLDVLQRKMSDPEVFQIVNKKSRFLPYLADDFRDNLFSTSKATAAAATRPLLRRINRTVGTPLVQQTSVGKDGKVGGGEMEEAVTPGTTLLQNTNQETSVSSQQENIKMPVTRPPLPPRSRTGKEKVNNMNLGFTTVSVSEVSSPSPFDSIISPPVLTEAFASPEDEQVSPMSHTINSILPFSTSDANTSTIGNAGPTSGCIAGAAAAAATNNTMTGTAAVPDVSPAPKPSDLLEPFEAQRQQSILVTSPLLTEGQPAELHLETRHLSKASTFPIVTTSSPSQPSSPSNPRQPSRPSQSLLNSPSQPRNSSAGFSTNQEEKACLLVDDNPINLHILASAMRKTHRPFATARNGLEAVEIYKESPGRYKWVLMDISMPVMDGLEATRRIREFEREYPVQRSRSLGRSLTKRGSAANKADEARARAGSLGTGMGGGVGVPAGVEVGVGVGSGAVDGKRVIQRKVGRASLDGAGLEPTPAPAPVGGEDRSEGVSAGTDQEAAQAREPKGAEVNGDDMDDGVTETDENSTEGEPVKGLEPATVVALTGVTSGTIQKDALASGVDLFLTKPVRMKDLGAILGDG